MRKVSFGLICGLSVAVLSGCSSLSEMNTDALGSALGDATGVPALSNTAGLQKGLEGATLTDAEVIQEAKRYAEMSDKVNKVAVANNPYNVRLQRIIKKHITEDGLKLDFKVYLEPQFNAFALANGSIRVYSGMMDRLNDAELLSVIGHEIGHVKLGHSKAQLSKALMMEGAMDIGASYAGDKASSSLGLGAGSIGSNVVKNTVDGAGEKVMEIVMAKFSREDELAADDYGLKFLKRNKYDPKSSINALNKVAMISEEESALAFLTASHPEPKERAERLAEQLGIPLSEADKAPATQSASINTSTTDAKSTTAASATETSPAPAAAASLNAPAAPKLSPYRGWVIQVTAETDEVIANEKISTLAESSIKAEVQEAIVKGTTYFRVLVGPYRSKESAEQDLERITNFGVNVGKPFIKPITE